MNTYSDIENALRAYRRDSDRLGVTVLSTLLGELQNKIPKDSTAEKREQKTVSIVKKFVESVNETIGYSAPEKQKDLYAELEILEKFLPKQMSEAELTDAIQEIFASGVTNLGLIMKALKAKYQNSYDGKMASQIVNSFIKG